MQFIGYDSLSSGIFDPAQLAARPFQKLKNEPDFLVNANNIYQSIIKDIKLLWAKAELVHGDLSEYNILGLVPIGQNYNERFTYYIIDISQALLNTHYLARQLLLRDLNNINIFFSRINTKEPVSIVDFIELFKDITISDPLPNEIFNFNTSVHW
jgi:serine/threonine-protein kinase RIO1